MDRPYDMFVFLTLHQFVVALLMSLAGLCVFFWAVAGGLFKNIEQPKFKILELEPEERHHESSHAS